MVDIKPLNIWTECCGDDGNYILNRYAHVNRVGYYISKFPYAENDDIFVDIPSEDWDPN